MSENGSRQGLSGGMLATFSMLSLLLAACGDDGALSARAAEPQETSARPSVLDPALDSLEGVTHHG